MAKVSRGEREVGFEAEATRENFLAKLVEYGVITREEFAARRERWRSPIDIAETRTAMEDRGDDPLLVEELVAGWQARSDKRAAASDADADWAVTADVARLHIERHDQNGARGRYPCTAWPCRALGVSFALHELCMYISELSSPALGIADELAELLRGLAKIDRAASKTRARLSERQRVYEDWAQMGPVRPAPWQECIEALNSIGPFMSHLEDLAKRVREQVLSREHRKYQPGTPGRRTQWLLDAMSRHLADAGFGFE